MGQLFLWNYHGNIAVETKLQQPLRVLLRHGSFMMNSPPLLLFMAFLQDKRVPHSHQVPCLHANGPRKMLKDISLLGGQYEFEGKLPKKWFEVSAPTQNNPLLSKKQDTSSWTSGCLQYQGSSCSARLSSNSSLLFLMPLAMWDPYFSSTSL